MNFELTPVERIKGMKLPEKISPRLAYFCGVLAGDGSIRFQKEKNHWRIKCVGNPANEKEFYDIILKNTIKKLFNLDVETKFFDKKRSYGFGISSKNLVKYLTEFIGLPLGKKYDRLKIPEIIKKDVELTSNFIKGVADTDFCLRIKKRNYPVICGTSKSKSFMEEIKDFLEKENFRVCMYKREDNDKRVNKIVITYRIEISGHAHFKMWMDKIGLNHPKYRDKIKSLLY